MDQNMLQRVQTLFWLIAALTLGALTIFPVADYGTEPLRALSLPSTLKNLQLEETTTLLGFPILVLVLLCAFLNGAAIPLYRKPHLQIRFSLLGTMLQSALTLLLMALLMLLNGAKGIPLVLRPASILPFVATLATWLALRGVIRDQKFLKRMNSLR